MEREETVEKVHKTLCDIAFTPATGTAVGYQVRCLEILARMLGLFDGSTGVESVTVVEDV